MYILPPDQASRGPAHFARSIKMAQCISANFVVRLSQTKLEIQHPSTSLRTAGQKAQNGNAQLAQLRTVPIFWSVKHAGRVDQIKLKVLVTRSITLVFINVVPFFQQSASKSCPTSVS